MSYPKNDGIVAVLATTLLVIAVSSQIKPIAQAFSSITSRLYLQLVLKQKKEVEETSVTAVYRYPVKSLRAIKEHDGAKLGPRGFEDDRGLMLVVPLPTPIWGYFKPGEATHRFLTQRQCPSFARVSIEIKNRQLYVSTQDKLPKSSIVLPMEAKETAQTYLAKVWGSTVSVQDLGDEAASYFQQILNADPHMPEELKDGVRLVVQAKLDARAPNSEDIPGAARSLMGTEPKVSLADGFPLLITSEASLKELNRHLTAKGKDPLPISRFRPNIVIRGTEPFAEDRIKVLQVGEAILYVISGCPRCKQSCTDQETGEVTDEPLETLREFRQMTDNPELLYFGANAIPAAESVGKVIRSGDIVRVLEYGEPMWSEG